MKKKLLLVCTTVVFGILTVAGISQQNVPQLSDVALANIEAIALGWISQIQYRNIIAIILFCDGSIASQKVTLRIGRDKTHTRRTAVFQIWI